MLSYIIFFKLWYIRNIKKKQLRNLFYKEFRKRRMHISRSKCQFFWKFENIFDVSIFVSSTTVCIFGRDKLVELLSAYYEAHFWFDPFMLENPHYNDDFEHFVRDRLVGWSQMQKIQFVPWRCTLIFLMKLDFLMGFRVILKPIKPIKKSSFIKKISVYLRGTNCIC